MGKFDGMLLVSDFDNTLLYTAAALQTGAATPPLPERNLAGIRRFMAEGGTFAVATGRALAAYRRAGGEVPTNAPTIVDNGGAIYDLRTGEYLLTRFLAEGTREHIGEVMAAFSDISLELYHPDESVQVMRPCPWNEQHAALTGVTYEVLEEITPQTVAQPLCKALFVGTPERLEEVRAFIRAQSWGADYELIFSSEVLLEMTARGADKGHMVGELLRATGCTTLLCAGDHMNDLPMLQAADRAFCPKNAVPGVLNSGATVVCDCREGAVGEIVELLERENK